MNQKQTHAPDRNLVVVVDDDRGSRENLHSLMSKFGFTPLCILDWHYLSFSYSFLHNVKAILININVRALNGYNAIRKIRKTCRRKPGMEHLPVIALCETGIIGKRCVKAGCEEFVVKPVQCEDLVNVFIDLGLLEGESSVKGEELLKLRKE